MQSQAIAASSRPRKETCVETVELNEQTARWESFRWPFADEGKAHAWARKAKRMTIAHAHEESRCIDRLADALKVVSQN